MMHTSLKKLIILGTILTFAIFTTTGFFMKMENMDGGKNDCMFMSGENALCNMGITTHLTHWRQTATTNLDDALLLTLLAMTYVVVRILQPKIASAVPIKKQKGKNRVLEKFDFIREALRAGVLHPKIYEKNVA